jgi:EAL domain-containing protein (putative c-di-GMP-specific phosphodiesterase class I)
MSAGALTRMHLEGELREVIAADGLQVHFQPVVALDDGSVVGAEALVRWHDRRGGAVAPAQFIPLAEETGLIVPLGLRVLERAVDEAKRWREHCPGFTVSVNLSGRQLKEPSIVDDVARILRDADLDPSALVLEVTETVLIDDAAAALERLDALKRLGVRLAIDDFGTGYSSLTYLQRFPFDVVKIDKSFVDSVGGDAGFALVKAIVDLATAVELDCIAEGVERVEQAQRLLALGCRRAQGYLYARPMPAEQLMPLLLPLPHQNVVRDGRAARATAPTLAS